MKLRVQQAKFEFSAELKQRRFYALTRLIGFALISRYSSGKSTRLATQPAHKINCQLSNLRLPSHLGLFASSRSFRVSSSVLRNDCGQIQAG